MPYTILKGEDDNWKVKCEAFTVQNFQPNLRRIAKSFTTTVDPEHFILRCRLGWPAIQESHQIFNATSTGGCWKIYTPFGRMVMIYDKDYRQDIYR